MREDNGDADRVSDDPGQQRQRRRLLERADQVDGAISYAVQADASSQHVEAERDR